MKKTISLKLTCVFLLLVIKYSYAQESKNCPKSIDFLLKTLVEKSPSYNYTIEDKKAFLSKVDSIKKVSINYNNQNDCSISLQKILRNIHDGHLQILVKNDVNLSDSISTNTFLKSVAFNSLQKINLESLVSQNITKKDYHSLSDSLDILIIQNKPNSFKGYVSNSYSRLWKKGEQILNYSKVGDSYEGIIYNRLKNPRFFKANSTTELFKKFNISEFKKQDCLIFNKSNKKLSIKIIDDKILYISIRSFKNLTKEENKEFFDFFEKTVLPNYNKYENIIFDVRNNPGGAMAYYPLIKGIKKNKESKNIYVLQNRFTASAAELFIIHLSETKKVITIGENTVGMTAFRDIHQVSIPDTNYAIFLPTKVFNNSFKEFLKYEFVGLSPQIKLPENSNWLNSTIEIIKKNF